MFHNHYFSSTLIQTRQIYESFYLPNQFPILHTKWKNLKRSPVWVKSQSTGLFYNPLPAPLLNSGVEIPSYPSLPWECELLVLDLLSLTQCLPSLRKCANSLCNKQHHAMHKWLVRRWGHTTRRLSNNINRTQVYTVQVIKIKWQTSIELFPNRVQYYTSVCLFWLCLIRGFFTCF